MQLLYAIGVRLYLLGIHIAAWFSPKARLWVEGRKKLFEKLSKNIPPDKPLIWMHCASLGEFEQGSPVLEELRKSYPDHFILLTFFSPSGYEIRKTTPLADYVSYLPGDTLKNAKQFLALTQPQLSIFVKYEFWLHHLQSISDNQIPVLLISAIFRPEQHFFKWYGAPFKKALSRFNHLFVQNEASLRLLQNAELNNCSLCGDTRIDRVAQLPKKQLDVPSISIWAHQNKPVLIAGSTWPPDEDLLCKWINQHSESMRLMIAPHDIHPKHIQQIIQKLDVPYSCFSDAHISPDSKVVIIDTIGMLSGLYRYGQIAYIGGGFGKGIHNTLEPATFGLPILMGPNYHKFEEANQLIRKGGAFCIHNYQELENCLSVLENQQSYHNASRESLSYIERHVGASHKIINYIHQLMD